MSEQQDANEPSIPASSMGADAATPSADGSTDAAWDAAPVTLDAGATLDASLLLDAGAGPRPDASLPSDAQQADGAADAAAVGVHPRDASAAAPPVTVTGPITNGKQFTLPAVYDLAAHDYVEQEFFFAGRASAYTLQGAVTMDGKWAAAEGDEADFKSRLLVRRPASAAKFNGTVIFEWFNVTGGIDYDPCFRYNWEEILREGYAWVGVSAQADGVEGGLAIGSLFVDNAPPALKLFDPERYGTLSHPGDAYSYDIFTQAAKITRHPGALDVLGGLEPERLIAYGESQSAFHLVTYVNAVHPLAKAYDGFFIHSRGGGGSALSDSLFDPVGSSSTPVRIRTDLEQPVFQFQTETDVFGMLAFAPARQPDTDRVRTWEVAGTSHADLHVSIAQFDLGCSGVNDGPQQFVIKAALHGLNRWIVDGTGPAKGEPFMLDANASPVVDEHGNVRGGVRSPDVDVPIAKQSGITDSDNFICVLFGQTTPFSSDELKKLYPTHEDYVQKVSTSARATREAGFLLPPEEQAMVAEASAASVPP